jgi:hypothetical protein
MDAVEAFKVFIPAARRVWVTRLETQL